MTQFPGTFIGFFELVSEVLKDLGDEWRADGKFQWASVFYESSDKVKDISESMAKLKDEFELAEQNPKDLVEDFVSDIKKVIAK